MAIKKEPFRKYRLDEEVGPEEDKVLSVRLTYNEREQWFLPAKKFIKQAKSSTALKQLAEIGAEVVLHDKKIHRFLDIINNNSRKNKRLGVTEKEIESL